MATAVLNRHGFPDGTVVGAWPAQNSVNGGPPSGSATASATVTSGVLTFTGLTVGARYIAYASGRGVSFRADETLGQDGAGVFSPERRRLEYLEASIGLEAVGAVRDRVDVLEPRVDSVEDNTPRIVNVKGPVGIFSGATGDGSTNDLPVVQAHADALAQAGNARGGFLFFPGDNADDYLLSGTLDLTDKVGVGLLGPATVTQNQPRLLYTAATGSLIDARGSQGFTMMSLRAHASSAAYSGDLIKFGADVGNTSLVKIENCWISGVSGSTGRLVVLNGTTEALVRNCALQHGNYGIVGTDGNFSNSVVIEGCSFNFFVLSNVRNPGQGWTITGNSMEPLLSGAAGAISHDGVSTAFGVTIAGNWMGDVTVDAGKWIQLKANGLVISGNYMESPGATGRYVRLESCEGVSITGNKFNGAGTAIDYAVGTTSGVLVAGNDFQGVSAVEANTANSQQVTITGNDGIDNATRGEHSATGFIYAYRGNAFQVRVGDVASSAGVLFGSGGDAYINRAAAAVMNVESAWQFPERADPTAPAANKAILYCKDNGAGKSQLVVRFPTGAVQVLATEP